MKSVDAIRNSLAPTKRPTKERKTLNSRGCVEEITLDHVAGITSTSKYAICSSVYTGHVVIPVSSIIVVWDPRETDQSYIENPSSREISAVTYSDDGCLLAYGERGVNPFIAVLNAEQYTQLSRFKLEGHCTTKALQFHPRALYLAVLPADDYSIYIYDFLRGVKLATTRWSVEPLAITISREDNILAVCGHRKVMCYSTTDIGLNNYKTYIMLDKRAVPMGKETNYTFVDITSGKGHYAKYIYSVTSCGILCQIQCGAIVIDHLSKINNKIFCLKFELDFLFVGCDKGVIQVCSPSDLTVITSVSDNDTFMRDELQPLYWTCDEREILALTVNRHNNIVTALISYGKKHSWNIEVGEKTVELTPVTPVSAKDESCPANDQMTSHDLQCSFAQMLLRIEINKMSEKYGKPPSRSECSRLINVNAIKITPDGKNIISGHHNGEIKVFEALTGSLTTVIEAHQTAVTCIETMYDDRYKLIASGGRDRIIFIIDADKNYGLVQIFNDHSSAIVSLSMAHSHGFITLVSSATDGVILIRRAPEADKIHFLMVGELPEYLGSRTRAYNYSKGFIITGQERGRINLFPMNPSTSLRVSKTIQIGAKLLKTVTIDPTGTFFVAYSSADQYLFHLATGRQIATLYSMPGFSYIAFTPDLKYLINSNDSGCRFIWRLPKKLVKIMQEAKDKTKGDSQDNASKGISPQSYSSCVRLCKKLVSRDLSADEYAEKDDDMKPISTVSIYKLGSSSALSDGAGSSKGLVSEMECKSLAGLTDCRSSLDESDAIFSDTFRSSNRISGSKEPDGCQEKDADPSGPSEAEDSSNALRTAAVDDGRPGFEDGGGGGGSGAMENAPRSSNQASSTTCAASEGEQDVRKTLSAPRLTLNQVSNPIVDNLTEHDIECSKANNFTLYQEICRDHAPFCSNKDSTLNAGDQTQEICMEDPTMHAQMDRLLHSTLDCPNAEMIPHSSDSNAIALGETNYQNQGTDGTLQPVPRSDIPASCEDAERHGNTTGQAPAGSEVREGSDPRGQCFQCVPNSNRQRKSQEARTAEEKNRKKDLGDGLNVTCRRQSKEMGNSQKTNVMLLNKARKHSHDDVSDTSSSFNEYLNRFCHLMHLSNSQETYSKVIRDEYLETFNPQYVPPKCDSVAETKDNKALENSPTFGKNVPVPANEPRTQLSRLETAITELESVSEIATAEAYDEYEEEKDEEEEEEETNEENKNVAFIRDMFFRWMVKKCNNKSNDPKTPSSKCDQDEWQENRSTESLPRTSDPEPLSAENCEPKHAIHKSASLVNRGSKVSSLCNRSSTMDEISCPSPKKSSGQKDICSRPQDTAEAPTGVVSKPSVSSQHSDTQFAPPTGAAKEEDGPSKKLVQESGDSERVEEPLQAPVTPLTRHLLYDEPPLLSSPPRCSRSRSGMDSMGSVAELFNNQSEYLRKLKEIRENFEKSIKALSEERRNQQMAAQSMRRK